VRVNLACVNTPTGQVTVIRPAIPEPGWPGVRFYTGVEDLVDRQGIRNLRSLGSLNGVSLWAAEWISCPLDVSHSAANGQKEPLW